MNESSEELSLLLNQMDQESSLIIDNSKNSQPLIPHIIAIKHSSPQTMSSMGAEEVDSPSEELHPEDSIHDNASSGVETPPIVIQSSADPAAYAHDKGLVVFKDFPSSMRSKHWKLGLMINYQATREKIKLHLVKEHAKKHSSDKSAELVSQGIVKIRDSDTYIVCKVCWTMTNTPLDSCLVACKSNAIYVSQNLNQHFTTKLNKKNNCSIHRAAWNRVFPPSASVATNSTSDEQPSTKKQRHHEKGSSLASNSCSSSRLTPAKRPSLGQVSLDQLVFGDIKSQEKTKKEAIREIHVEAFRFISDSNISPTSVHGTAFAQFTNFCVQQGANYGRYLRSIQDNELTFGRRRYLTIQAESFAEMVNTVTRVVARVRAYHTVKTGTKEGSPFIYVAHDIWEGRRKCILGLSIFFVDPVEAMYVQIPLGFVVCKGKTAALICDQSLQLLGRYGISGQDLLQPINDTTNSALLAGRLIVGGGIDGKCESGTCLMHRGSLAINHAGGFLTRSKSGAITDSFPQCSKFRRNVHDMVSYLMDRKAKDRWKRYSAAVNTSYKCDPIIIPTPNKTRVNGVSLMYDAAIRSCHSIRAFQARCSGTDPLFLQSCLTGKEWSQLAEYCAVFRILSKFLMSIQSDDYGYISLSRVLLGDMLEDLYSPSEGDRIFQPIFRSMTLQVADVNGSDWSPRVVYKDIPKITLSYSSISDSVDAGAVCDGTVSDDTRTLVERIFIECERYFSEWNDDEEQSLLFNPLTVIAGTSYLLSIGMIREEQLLLMESKLIDRVVKYYTSGRVSLGVNHGNQNNSHAAVAGMINMAASMLPQPPSANDIHLQDKFKKRKIASAGKALKPAPISGDNQERKSFYYTGVKEEFNAFKAWLKDEITEQEWWFLVMRYPSKWMKKNIDKELSEIPISERPKSTERAFLTKGTHTSWALIPDNCIYTHKRFDVLQFWKGHSERFPLLYPVAITVLAKPPTNARQERLFSLATWFDDNLRQRLSESGFEMRLLEKANRDFVASENKRLRREKSLSKPLRDNFVALTVEQVLVAQEALARENLREGNDTEDALVAEAPPEISVERGSESRESIMLSRDLLLEQEDDIIIENDQSGILDDLEENDTEETNRFRMCLAAIRDYSTRKNSGYD